MSRALRYSARVSAYLIALLLAAVWTFGALDTFTRPLLDLGRPHIGDAILVFARMIALPPETIFTFAHLLAGLKFMVGAFLFAALIGSVYEKLRFGSCDDAMFDVALFTAALASLLSALPGLMHGGELLLASIGELMLCVIASALAINGRGYIIGQELPRVVRPGYGYSARA